MVLDAVIQCRGKGDFMKPLGIAEQVNQIAAYLAVRDMPVLNSAGCAICFQKCQADLLLLLGNGLPRTAELAAKAYHDRTVKKIMVCGGVGHSTAYLWDAVKADELYQEIAVEGRAEADIFFDLLTQIYRVPAEDILVENQSQNCGDNALKAYDMLTSAKEPFQTVILMQDPTMQRRSYENFKKEFENSGIQFYNFAPFVPQVTPDIRLINGMEGIWTQERFFELLLGEVPRLRDDENGYGPRGKGYIGHVEIPQEILEADQAVKEFTQILTVNRRY